MLEEMEKLKIEILCTTLYLGGVYGAENAAVLGLSFWRNDDIGIVSCGSSLWN